MQERLQPLQPASLEACGVQGTGVRLRWRVWGAISVDSSVPVCRATGADHIRQARPADDHIRQASDNDHGWVECGDVVTAGSGVWGGRSTPIAPGAYTYIHTYLLTYLLTHLLTCQRARRTSRAAFLHTYIHTYILTYSLTRGAGVPLGLRTPRQLGGHYQIEPRAGK